MIFFFIQYLVYHLDIFLFENKGYWQTLRKNHVDDPMRSVFEVVHSNFFVDLPFQFTKTYWRILNHHHAKDPFHKQISESLEI